MLPDYALLYWLGSPGAEGKRGHTGMRALHTITWLTLLPGLGCESRMYAGHSIRRPCVLDVLTTASRKAFQDARNCDSISVGVADQTISNGIFRRRRINASNISDASLTTVEMVRRVLHVVATDTFCSAQRP